MRLAAFAAALFLGAAIPASALASDCDLLPVEVERSMAYSGWSESRLCAAGQEPLFSGLPDGVLRVTRFTFTHGHALFFRYVTITELGDGSGRLEFGGGDFRGRDIRREWIDMRTRRRDLTRAELVRLTELVDQTGAFEHDIGTWDGVGDEQRIYLHCELLEMERATPDDYRFSSVNIGCNQPRRLMPLVEHIMGLAGLRFSDDRRLIL